MSHLIEAGGAASPVSGGAASSDAVSPVSGGAASSDVAPSDVAPDASSALPAAASTGARPPKAVLWDLGGVFLDWNPRYLYRELFAGDDAAMEDFLTNVCSPAWHAEQDLGRSVVEACASLAAEYPEQASLIMAWGERSEDMIGGVISGTVDLLRELRAAGVPCYALSNMEVESWEKRRCIYEFISWFDGHFISGVERVAKPDRRYFELALTRFGLRAADLLFIDDREVNVEAAAGVGVQAIVFKDPEALRRELVARGLPVAAALG